MPISPSILKDAVEFPVPPGWGHIGQSYLGTLGTSFGVIRLMESGQFTYSQYPNSPWRLNPADSSQLFVSLQRKFIAADFGTLATLATSVHKQALGGQIFEKPTNELFVLAAVVAKLLHLLRELESAKIQHRLLDPTNIVYRWQSQSEPLAGVPKVDVWLPDAGFAFIGLPGSGKAMPDHVNPKKRWGEGRSSTDFSWLWSGKKLTDVDLGLSIHEEKAAVARMLAWVMEGKVVQQIPSRKATDSTSREFWNAHQASIWQVLEQAIGTEAIQAKTVPSNFYEALLRFSVAHHFKSSEVKVRKSSKFPWPAIGMVALAASLIGVGVYFSDSISVLFKPPPEIAPLAICPDCSAESSPEMFSKIEELQKHFLELNVFEERFVPPRNRFSTEDLKFTVKIPRPSSSNAEQSTFADTRAYLDKLVVTVELLASAKESLNKSQDSGKEDVGECLKQIAGSLEAHLYHVADAIRISASMDNGLAEKNVIQPKLKLLSEKIADFIELSPKTKNCLETIY